MNPATDVGKKDLPPNIRSRFTEIDVLPPDADKDTLLSIIAQYIGHIAVSDKRIIMDIAEFYTAVKQVAESRQIADGSNHRPHFSMRTLVRALTFAADTASSYSLRRSVWEGCLMAFTMVLDGKSAETVVALARKHLLAGVKNPKSLLSKDPQAPPQGVFLKFGPFYLEKGPLEEDFADDYIITPSVEQKLIDLSRIILTRRFPVLIEGPTSAGKTSSIEYLAKRTGHRFVRINNHEHTDIQEYLGSYVSDPMTGKLVFEDGLLVQALRHGHWIVLDELNLAPTDVLEALNRLLDDNRELVVPETQEVVHPHPHFMLFATQNPPGLYAGRKVLSRAFRNRFLEVHFEDVPQAELETILCQRCQIAPSYGKRIVSVFRELQKRRQTSRVFESKQGFATLRDLFRWAGRDAVGYQELAENGYMLLAERTRRSEDKLVVKEVIESIMGVRIDEDAMYDLFRPGVDMNSYLGLPVPTSPKIIWTKAMQRLYILVCRGLKFNEPLLLVGETGSGKTSVCQVFADASAQRLLTLNCHQNTETADLIGGLRPVRNRGALRADIVRDGTLALKSIGVDNIASTVEDLGMKLLSIMKSNDIGHDSQVRLQTIYQRMLRLNSIFEWHDGPLVEAMRGGDVFLLDEISLADDSVLERLNSVLEPGRSIVLAERGGMDSEEAAIRASQDFKLLATMNPGGDYGKKELSPALRNRFTEIWVPPVDDLNDLQLIVGSLWQYDALQPYTLPVLRFVDWLCLRVRDRSLMALRDILAWVTFMNAAYTKDQVDGIPANELFHHAAHMTYLDGLSSLPQFGTYSRDTLDRLRLEALDKLQELAPLTEPLGSTVPSHDSATFTQLGSFAIRKGKEAPSRQSFNFDAPTTLNNAMRIVRACRVSKPILLEGSPGVGKTSLVTALANLSGHKLCRINLSDQTDLIDLFGSDLPVEGGAAGEFAWKDAEFLRALQEGHWVLLDEMNLAPQAVLEGLNAVLDHRGTVYIPELNRSFERHPSFRIFAAQNPLHQGGGRKGLPKSFVNRFTKVYVEELSKSDFYTVCSHLFPDIDEHTLRAMITFNIELNEKIVMTRAFAQDGSPWEFNLRDIIRWGMLVSTSLSSRHPQIFLRSAYLQRFRSLQDRSSARAIFDQVFSSTTRALEDAPAWTISPSRLKFGHFLCARRNMAPSARPKRILKMQLSALESLGDCVTQSWLAILTGPKSSGKTAIVRTLADFSGNMLWEVPVNSATDTLDILGSFEQIDSRRRLLLLIDEVIDLLKINLRSGRDPRNILIYQKQVLALRNLCENAPSQNAQALAKKMSTILSQLVLQGPTRREAYQEIHTSIEKLTITASNAGQFEWVDGPLIKAMKSGHWILLDGANLCGPSVLDRLNSLCETNGSLTLNERGIVDGEVQQIKPHPHFRLFMTVDPHYGELSRAMRNRGIEIALFPTPSSDDMVILHDQYRLPISLATSFTGTESAMFDAHRRGLLRSKTSKSTSPSSTGHSLDQDSALSHLVDQAPSLLFSAEPTGEESSWIHFLSQTLSPGYMARVIRYCALPSMAHFRPIIRDFLSAFPQQSLNNALQVFRNIYVQQYKTSSEFALEQPMNLYLSEGLFDATSEMEDVSRRSIVFEALNLSAALFICEHKWSLRHQEQFHLPEKNRKVYQTVFAIRGEMIRIARSILERLSITAVNMEDLRLASQLLGLNDHLIGTLDTTSYDFSTLYAVSDWLRHALEKSSAIFSSLRDQSIALHALASLSTGLGLFAVWSKLYLNDPSPVHRMDTSRIESMAASLKGTANIPALRLQAFNVVSVESLPPALKQPHAKQLPNLHQILDECLTANATEERAEVFTYIDPNTVLLELQLLSHCAKSYDLNSLLKGMVEMVCNNMKTSFIRLVPYQHLVWAIEARADKSPYIARAQLCWLEGLWNASSDVLLCFSILFSFAIPLKLAI
ncbi:P-loop containing nucleoside triphosphate hydrolase protein [Gymnopilus junonius]|uniref:Midasin n=1 Tax=Gymnopilus junonius TaxID=109634 RepID=A0A9P5NGP0_GYMJU|nr:P-loop containing nucleoside triphosphate hydrolase protein [Gymnopilus junonius]